MIETRRYYEPLVTCGFKLVDEVIERSRDPTLDSGELGNWELGIGK